MLWVLLLVPGSLALLGLLVVFGIATWTAYQYVQVKRVPLYGHPSQFGLEYEDVVFPSRRDRVSLRGWYLPSRSERRCVILVQGEEHHRNSPGIKALQLGRDLVERDFSVLLFDFRGRGESDGRRGSAGDREQWDVLGALDYVEKQRGIPVERIALVGFSMGAAVALLVAAREPRIPAVVADSAFVDYIPTLRHVPFYWFYLPAWFAVPIVLAGRWFLGADFSKVRPLKAVGRIRPRPIFFIHGENDHVIPYQESQELYQASGNQRNQLWIVPGAGHVHSYARVPQEYASRVASFLEMHIT